jgi:hypothetical protein
MSPDEAILERRIAPVRCPTGCSYVCQGTEMEEGRVPGAMKIR